LVFQPLNMPLSRILRFRLNWARSGGGGRSFTQRRQGAKKFLAVLRFWREILFPTNSKKRTEGLPRQPSRHHTRNNPYLLPLPLVRYLHQQRQTWHPRQPTSVRFPRPPPGPRQGRLYSAPWLQSPWGRVVSMLRRRPESGTFLKWRFP
jgi:hypothetical protein